MCSFDENNYDMSSLFQSFYSLYEVCIAAAGDPSKLYTISRYFPKEVDRSVYLHNVSYLWKCRIQVRPSRLATRRTRERGRQPCDWSLLYVASSIRDTFIARRSVSSSQVHNRTLICPRARQAAIVHTVQYHTSYKSMHDRHRGVRK
jgi:hypothetical protein